MSVVVHVHLHVLVGVVVALYSCWAAGPGHAQNQFGRYLTPPHRNHGSAGA